MVNDSWVVGVGQDRIVFDRFSGYRMRPGQTWGLPVREFVARRWLATHASISALLGIPEPSSVRIARVTPQP